MPSSKRGKRVPARFDGQRVACLGLQTAQAPFWLMAEEIRSGQVQVALPDLQPERVPIHLVYPAGRRVPMRARVRVFIEYLVSAFTHPEL